MTSGNAVNGRTSVAGRHRRGPVGAPTDVGTQRNLELDRARLDGFTETLLGRRRYIPELTSGNRRLQALGERQALNAPIQGSASDVFKVAMIEVARALRERRDLECHMLLTVHDELVFEVPEANAAEAAGIVGDRMEHAVELEVPLRADIGWGPTWSDAAPAGH